MGKIAGNCALGFIVVAAIAFLATDGARGGEPAAAISALMIVVCLTGLGVIVYFLPAIVASEREHPQATAILWLNILLGWSVVGWAAAVVWANTNPATVTVGGTHGPTENASPGEKTCPRCAETVKAAALVCRYCGYEFPPAP